MDCGGARGSRVNQTVFDQAEDLYLSQTGYIFGLYVDVSKNGLDAKLYQYKEKDEC